MHIYTDLGENGDTIYPTIRFIKYNMHILAGRFIFLLKNKIISIKKRKTTVDGTVLFLLKNRFES